MSGGKQIDDLLNGFVGAVVGGFELAVRAVFGVGTVVEGHRQVGGRQGCLNVGNLVKYHLLVANSRYRNRHLLCFLDAGFKQSCEALQLFRISELHELHFALSNGCGINRFREATIIDKTG